MESEEIQLGRRGVLRGGAIMAGVAAGALIAGTQASTAEAAVGDQVTVGGDFSADNQATTLRVSDSTDVPALRLVNPTGPALQIDPITAAEPADSLPVGALAGGDYGPWVGVTDGKGGSVTTFLATAYDLDTIPRPVPIDPTRLLDTRTAAGRANILRTSPGAFDGNHRLKAGAWLDLVITDADQQISLNGAFLNITVTGPLANGFISACPSPRPRPVASTLNYVKGQTLANGAFIGVGIIDTSYVQRFYTNATTHLIVDLTAVSLAYTPDPDLGAAKTAKAARTRTHARAAHRRIRVMGRSRH